LTINKGFYGVYTYGDELKPGDEMKIGRSVWLREYGSRLESLIAMPQSELEKLREDKAAAERAVFDRLCEATGEWDALAAETALMDRAIAYLKIPAVVHTSNEWKDEGGGYRFKSNTVYQMSYRVYEDTKFDRDTKKHTTKAWYLTWGVTVSDLTKAGNYGYHTAGSHKIAGQNNKRFTKEAEMDKYLAGRIKAYDHLFTKENPPIPQEYAKYFKVYDMLLPGYNVEGEAVRTETAPGRETERPSVLKALTDKNRKETEPGNTNRKPPSPER
jgi:hypothetical protein